MAKSLLKPKPESPKVQRVAFDAPADAVERMKDLQRQAQESGFLIDLDAALADAYAGIAKKLARELKAAGAFEGAAPDAADPSGARDGMGSAA